MIGSATMAHDAGPVNDFVGVRSHRNDVDLRAAPQVGICPHCGYPSLGSRSCAYCPPLAVSTESYAGPIRSES